MNWRWRPFGQRWTEFQDGVLVAYLAWLLLPHLDGFQWWWAVMLIVFWGGSAVLVVLEHTLERIWGGAR